MFLHYVPSCRIHYSAEPPVAPTFLDHHSSKIRPLPAYQHPSDQLNLSLPLQPSLLLSVVGFFLPFGAGLVSHLHLELLRAQPSIRHFHALLPLFPLQVTSELLVLTLGSYFGAF